MTVLELIEKLGELDLRAEVFTGPNVDRIAVVEQAGGHRDVPHYVVLLSIEDVI